MDFLKLCPMSFSEFLLAVGENGLYETLKAQDYELINAYAGKYVDLLKKYYYVAECQRWYRLILIPMICMKFVRSRTIFSRTMRKISASMLPKRLFRVL